MNKIYKKIPVFVFLACLLISCSSNKPIVSSQTQSNVQDNSINQNKKAREEISLEKLFTPAKKIKLPNVKDFGITHLRRISENKDEGGLLLPPFEYGEIDTAIFEQVKVGEKYTVIPLNVDIQPFQLPITKATKTKNAGCDEKEPEFLWAVEFEQITNKEILEIASVGKSTPEYPFDVFLIYPSVDFAENILQTELSAAMLPKNITIKTVEAAIDLDKDGKPDLLEIEFCCGDETQQADNCNYNCLKMFKKINGIWKLVDEAIPC